MPHLALRDLSLHYQVVGDGPPLMLVPGMFSDGASWAPLMAHLKPRFTVILPDPRGAGRSLPLDAPIALDTLAVDMLSLANHLGIGRLAVAGHSLGGLVALMMAGLAPDRITAVAALACSPLPSARLAEVFRSLAELRVSCTGDLWLRQLMGWLMHDDFFADRQAVEFSIAAGLAYPHLQPAAAMRHQARALGRLELAALPGRIEMPGLALLAEEDALIAPGPAGAALAAKGLQVEVLPGCAHSLHWDAPQRVASRLLAHFGATPA
ncbi:MAG: alpha/beta hydrolase [Roseivivax sp.]|nr:alpha/beta hydrolase [Roseivivax sp.]